MHNKYPHFEAPIEFESRTINHKKRSTQQIQHQLSYRMDS